jgi:transposase-like protein
VPRLFIIDGSKALAKAIRHSFGSHTPIQRCQIHKARNIMERLSPALHASVRRALRQAWELNDAAKAEKLIRNLAQRLERDAPGVSKSLLEGLDEILTVSRLGLPAELRRSLACTNIIENMMGTVRRVTRNVKRWSSSSMALRWTAAAMNEAKKGFRTHQYVFSAGVRQCIRPEKPRRDCDDTDPVSAVFLYPMICATEYLGGSESNHTRIDLKSPLHGYKSRAVHNPKSRKDSAFKSRKVQTWV